MADEIYCQIEDLSQQLDDANDKIVRMQHYIYTANANNNLTFSKLLFIVATMTALYFWTFCPEANKHNTVPLLTVLALLYHVYNYTKLYYFDASPASGQWNNKTARMYILAMDKTSTVKEYAL